MRRNFADMLKDEEIDIESEYRKLYYVLYKRGKDYSLYEKLQQNFLRLYFRGTCLTVEEFDIKHGYKFEEFPKDFTIDYLILICEYIQNMIINTGILQDDYFCGTINRSILINHINVLIEKIGYMRAKQDNFTIFVEKSSAAIAVAESELIPPELSYKVISYNHHSMKGNLQAKKETLNQLAGILEPYREKLKSANKELSDDLFYIFNNFNIRHNNIDSSDKSKYKKYIAKMKKDDLEYWYDETYQMCLLAFLTIENIDRKNKFKELKNTIENTK